MSIQTSLVSALSNPEETNISLLEKYGFKLDNLQFAHHLYLIEQKLQEKTTQNPVIAFQLIKEFINALSTEKPYDVHFNLARFILSHFEKNIKNMEIAENVLAFTFVTYFKHLDAHLLSPELSDSGKSWASSSLREHRGEKKTFPYEQEMFVWDKIFLRVLESTGKKGAEIARDIEKEIKLRFASYKDDPSVSFLELWFSPVDQKQACFYYCPALLLLGKAIWFDQVRKRIFFYEKNVPAITTNVHSNIIKLLSPHSIKVKIEQNIQIVYYGQEIVGCSNMATIPFSNLYCIQNGLKLLKSVNAHRLIHLLVTQSFYQMAAGVQDFRILRFDRGVSEITNKLGLRGDKAAASIKQILYAMAHVHFQEPHLAGSLIQLTKYSSPFTKRKNEGYQIMVGTILLPYYTFKAYENGDNGLLIPLLDHPPLIGANRCHAGQYLLQMELMSLFSSQSIELAQKGYICIRSEEWDRMGTQAGLTAHMLHQIKNRWQRAGNDGPKILETIGAHYYTLGSAYEKVLNFLINQGKRRLLQSQRAQLATKQKSLNNYQINRESL